MKMKKSGNRKNKNFKKDLKRRKKKFTIQDLQINSAGAVVNMDT
jgi:hypothetical protein